MRRLIYSLYLGVQILLLFTFSEYSIADPHGDTEEAPTAATSKKPIKPFEMIIKDHEPYLVDVDPIAKAAETTLFDIGDLKDRIRAKEEDDITKYQLMVQLGLSYTLEGNFGRANLHYDNALDLAEKLSMSKVEMASALLYKGIAQARHVLSGHYHPDPTSASKTFSSIPREARSLFWQGQYHWAHLQHQLKKRALPFDHDGVIDAYANIPRTAGTSFGQASYQIANIHYGNENYEAAAEFYLIALSVSAIPLDMRFSSLLQLARSQAFTGNYFLADQSYRQVLPFVDDQNFQFKLEALSVRMLLGNLYPVEDSLNNMLKTDDIHNPTQIIWPGTVEHLKGRFLLGLNYCAILRDYIEAGNELCSVDTVSSYENDLVIAYQSNTSMDFLIETLRDVVGAEGNKREEPALGDDWVVTESASVVKEDMYAPTHLRVSVLNARARLANLYEVSQTALSTAADHLLTLADGAAVLARDTVLIPLAEQYDSLSDSGWVS